MGDKHSPEPVNLKMFLRLKSLLVEAGANPLYVILPVIISLVLASLEGIQTALLFPLVKGAIALDFSFVGKVPVVKHIFSALPPRLSASNTAIFIMIAGTILVVVLVKSALKYGFNILSARYSKQLLATIKKNVFRRYLSFGKLFYDRVSLPELIGVIQHDVAAIIGTLNSFTAFIEGFFVLTVYAIILLKISWGMTLCALLIIPAIDLSMKWLIRKIHKTSLDQIEARHRFQRLLYNALTCMTLVKAYNNQKREAAEYSRRADALENLDFSMAKKRALIPQIYEIVTTVVILLIAIAMFISVNVGKANLAGFLIFFFILRRAMANFGIFNTLKITLASASGSLQMVESVMNDNDKFFITGGETVFSGLKEKIECGHLTFSYIPGYPVIKDLTFSVGKGKLTAVVGATGSGKTTLISLLMRFYDCPPSSIYIDGTDIRDYELNSLMKHVALVTQDTLLFADTLKNNIVYGVDRKRADERLTDVLKKAQLSDFVAQLPEGLDTPIGERGVMLSGGERQRVAIARALIKGSEILILDEATSSLDSVTEHLIQEAIDEAIKGRTAIVIAHRLSTIKKADKIIVLEHGALVEEGSLQELLDKKGKFFQYWEAQKFY